MLSSAPLSIAIRKTSRFCQLSYRGKTVKQPFWQGNHPGQEFSSLNSGISAYNGQKNGFDRGKNGFVLGSFSRRILRKPLIWKTL